MSINPFKVEIKSIENYFMNWDQMYPKSYEKNESDKNNIKAFNELQNRKQDNTTVNKK